MYDPLLKGVMLILLAAAAAVHILQPTLGDVAAAQRVAQAIVIPMLAAVAFRHVVEQLLHWDEFERAGWPLRRWVSPRRALHRPLRPPRCPAWLDETVRHQPKPEKEERQAPPRKRKEEAPARHHPGAAGNGRCGYLLLSSLEPSNIVARSAESRRNRLRADICVLAIVDEDVQKPPSSARSDNISQTGLRRDVLNLARHPSIVRR